MFAFFFPAIHRWRGQNLRLRRKAARDLFRMQAYCNNFLSVYLLYFYCLETNLDGNNFINFLQCLLCPDCPEFVKTELQRNHLAERLVHQHHAEVADAQVTEPLTFNAGKKIVEIQNW